MISGFHFHRLIWEEVKAEEEEEDEQEAEEEEVDGWFHYYPSRASRGGRR